MNQRSLAVVALAAWCSCPGARAGTAETVSGQIRAEATRSNQDAAGKPLPLVSHWTTGSHKLSAGWAPERQIELLEQGTSKHPWALSTPIEVFALALVQGKQPAREWLVYAHSPLAERRSLKLKIPEYRDIAVDVAVGGSFYEVDEKAGGVRPIQ